MKNLRIVVSTLLTGGILASFAATAVAAPSLVTPKRAVLRISNINCPGSADLKFVVWSKQQGPVKVQLERMGVGLLGSDIIQSDTKKEGRYKGLFSGKVSLTRSDSSEKYRIVATGNGKTTLSKWKTLRYCKIVM